MHNCALLGNIHVYHYRFGGMQGLDPAKLIMQASIISNGYNESYGQSYWDHVNNVCPHCKGTGKKPRRC